MENDHKLSMDLLETIKSALPGSNFRVSVCHDTLRGEKTEEYAQRLDVFYRRICEDYKVIPFMRTVYANLDTGTIESLLKDSNVIRMSSAPAESYEF